MPVTTIRVSDDLNERIEEALDYNDTKSDWFRKAAEEKLERDGVPAASGRESDD